MSFETNNLEELLSRASLRIVAHGRDGQLSDGELTTLRQLLLATRQRFVSILDTRLRNYTLHISDDSIKDELCGFIRRTLGQHFHDDCILTAGSVVSAMPSEGFHIDELVSKVAELTVLQGPVQAARTFMESVAEPSSKGKWICLLDGIGVTETLEIDDGMRLEPIPTSTTDFPPYLSHVLLSHVSDIELMGAALFLQDIVISPKFLNPAKGQRLLTDPNPFQIRGATSEINEFNRDQFYNALSLAFDTHVSSVAQWWYVDPDDIANLGLGSTTGGVSLSHNRTIRSSPRVSRSQIQEFEHLHVALVNLPDDLRRNLAIPISRLIASHGSRSLPDRIVDLSIALESIYVNESGGELQYRLSVRAAKHLGKDVEDRLRIYNDLKTFYSKLRSQVIHRGYVPSTLKMSDDQPMSPEEALKRVQELCSQAIREIMTHGFPDWEMMLLSS